MTPAETDPAAPPVDTTTFVLVEPSHAGNVGAAARAIKVMGFGRLVLVRPRLPDLHLGAEAMARATGAADVLEAARTVDTLAEALQGATLACATAMTPRDFGPPTQAPREALPEAAAAGHRVAFVFGPERTGLANDDVYRCHLCLSIPTHPEYGSLNLGQAVQLIAYDWRQALGGFAVRARAPAARWADAAAVQGLLEHWQQTLVRIGFLDPAVPKKLMPRLNQLANRARLTEEEVHILRGIARAAAAGAAARVHPAAHAFTEPSAEPAEAPARVPAASVDAASVDAGADMNRHPRSHKG
ncbi:MAG: RNA methyltransferase [Rubrivivax sp.]|nr:RNA methyltransferase [Rubrivivax sp.]